MATKTARRTEQDLLGVYLNDHLAGATVGVGLVRRMAASAEPGSETATVVKPLVSEITADRSALVKMMAAVGVKIRGYKLLAAWAGETTGSTPGNWTSSWPGRPGNPTRWKASGSASQSKFWPAADAAGAAHGFARREQALRVREGGACPVDWVIGRPAFRYAITRRPRIRAAPGPSQATRGKAP
jgi:hypothetical protein